jgi:2-C-methyl-D-erythritol 4-phosphate cytidylyltransferase
LIVKVIVHAKKVVAKMQCQMNCQFLVSEQTRIKSIIHTIKHQQQTKNDEFNEVVGSETYGPEHFSNDIDKLLSEQKR